MRKTPKTGQKTRHRGTVLAVVVSGLALFMFGMQSNSWLRVDPGPVLDVPSTLDVISTDPGDPLGEGSIAFPTIVADPVTHFEALWCATFGDCEVRDLDTISPAGTGAKTADESLDAASQAATLYAAENVDGYSAGNGWPDAPGEVAGLGDVRGPSAGLAVALYLLDLRTAGSLLGDNAVVATGTISPDGTVGAVGGVKHKSIATARQGADVLFVPAADVDDVTPGPELEVVPVADLDDVVSWLCAHGGTGPLCGPPATA